MSLIPEKTSPYGVVTTDEVRIGDTPKESGALKVVVQDFLRSSQWVGSKQYGLRWDEAQSRYEPIHTTDFWEGTTIPRSSLDVYLVAEIVQSILPQVVQGIFSDDPPFVVQPRPGTSGEEARAVSSILHYQTEDCDLRQEITTGVLNGLNAGTAVWKWDWESFDRKVPVFTPKASPISVPSSMAGGQDLVLQTADSNDFDMKEEDETTNRPILEWQDLRHVFVDPKTRVGDIRKAKWVITQNKLSAEALEDLRNVEGYEIPSKAELMKLIEPSGEKAPASELEARRYHGNMDHQAQNEDQPSDADPTQDETTFEVLERFDGRKTISVLNRKLVIRNTRNRWGRHPFLSVNFWDVPNSFYGIGVGIIAGDEQLNQRGLINASVDQTTFNLNRPMLVPRGKDTLTQNIVSYLGKVVPVEDPAAVKPMPKMEAVPEVYAEIQASTARAGASTGANEMTVQGSMGGAKSSITRTATGANWLGNAAGARLEFYVERLADQVIIPTLNAFFELDRQLLPTEDMADILSDEMQQAWKGDHIKIRNARVRFDILAAARMRAKQQMAQYLPILLQQLLTDPVHAMLTQAGRKVDINELINMVFDVSGWKNKADVVVPMTEEDYQRQAAQAQQQMQLAQMKQGMKTDGRLQELDADNAGRAYREVQRSVLEKQLTPMQLNGEPNPNGLGA